jgi:L-histidine N-alpha-methyltransferase
MRVVLEADVRAGLTASPKTLPPKWFYDARGSELFGRITTLAEYYPTRRERDLLRAHAAQIAELTRADTLIELGSGTSEKTRTLLDALAEAGTLQRYVPFDVDESVLRQAGRAVAEEYPEVDVHAVIGDFEHHLPLLPTGGRRLIAFLGGTIGNLMPVQRAAFLHTLASTMASGDALLLGTDLVKDPQRLVAAYDDAAGVTAEFNRNVLHVLARELGADLDPEAFAHVRSPNRWCGCWTWRCRSPQGRSCAPRSARSSGGPGCRERSRPPGWSWASGGPTPTATMPCPCPSRGRCRELTPAHHGRLRCDCGAEGGVMS